MSNINLQGYIDAQLKRGVDKNSIKESLIIQGWKEKDIEEAYNLTRDIEKTNLTESKKNSSKKNSKRIMVIILFIILGLVIVGGAVFAYFKFFQSPEMILLKMGERMNGIKTIEYSGQIELELSLDESSDVLLFLNSEKENSDSNDEKTVVDFYGSIDSRDENNLKNTLGFDIKNSMLENSLGLETKIIGKDVYFTLLNIPPLGFLDLSFLKNQWIKVTTEEIESQVDRDISKSLSPENKEEIIKAMKENPIYEFIEKIDNETINSADTFHLRYKINNENFLVLIEKIAKIISEEESNDSELELELEQIKNFLLNNEAIEGEIWIGKKDFLLYKMTLEIKTKEIENSNSINNISISINLKNHNQDLTIEAPASSKNIEQVVEEVFIVIFSSMTEGDEFEDQDFIYENDSINETGIYTDAISDGYIDEDELDIEYLKITDSDNDGLSDYEEIYIYGTDPLNPDTDGDGYLDGEEVKNGYNPNGQGGLL